MNNFTNNSAITPTTTSPHSNSRSNCHLNRRKRNQRLLALALSASLLTACAPPRDGANGPNAVAVLGTGIGFLVATPLFIAVSLVEGLSALPYLESADLHEVDREMRASGSQVDIKRTYQYAYQQRLDSVPSNGDTGQMFYNMHDATQHFREVLRGYGVENPQEYLLTAIRTADRQGYTLYAVIHRPAGVVRISSRSGPRVLHTGQQAYYQPWRINSAGQAQDTVIDWAGVPRKSIGTQKGQAIMMTLAANAVLLNRRSDDYWQIEQRWMRGEHRQIVNQRKTYLEGRLGLHQPHNSPRKSF